MRRTHATSRRAAVIGLAAALVAATGPVASAGPKDDDVDAELEALLQDSESAQDHDDGDATPPDGDAPPPGEVRVAVWVDPGQRRVKPAQGRKAE